MKNSFFNQIFKNIENPADVRGISVYGHHWRMALADGIAMLVLAIVALYLPLTSGAQLSRSLSALFLIGGIIYLSQTFEVRHEKGSVTRLLQACLLFVVGSVLYQYSDSGMLGITLGLSFYFFFGSILSWVFYSEVRPHGGWNWGAISAIVSFCLGLYLAAIFPLAPLWLPGTLFAIELLASGVGMIGFALSARKFVSNHQNLPSEPLHIAGSQSPRNQTYQI